MKLDKFIFFITSTVMFGAVIGGLCGRFVDLPWYSSVIEGGLLGTNCLMGFWAFLMLNFTSSMTLPSRVWRWTQMLLIGLVLYDMVYWRYHFAIRTSSHGHLSLVTYALQGLLPFLVAVVAALVKRRLSGKGNILPTVFFVYVFTVVDWLLVLRLHASAVINQTGFIMLACNVYMILIYSFMLNHEQPLDEVNEGEIVNGVVRNVNA